MRKTTARILCALVLLTQASWCADTASKPILRLDLKQFGYDERAAGDYTTAGFLTDDLLLIAINQRIPYGNHRAFEDKPDSTIVLYDISKMQTVRVAHMPVFKQDDSVAPALDSHFLVITLSEVKLCSVDMQCDRSFATKGKLWNFWVSFKRDKVVLEGEFGTPRAVLDSRTLTPLDDPNQDAVRIPAEQHYHLFRDRRMVESRLSADGQRLMTSEARYTRWNKVINPLGALGDRPFNYQRVTVYDQQRGKELFTFHWDPRPRAAPWTPKISPTGRRVAVFIKEVLEVFDVPIDRP